MRKDIVWHGDPESLALRLNQKTGDKTLTKATWWNGAGVWE